MRNNNKKAMAHPKRSGDKKSAGQGMQKKNVAERDHKEKLTRQKLTGQTFVQEVRELPEDVLIGRNAVTEALRAGRGINKILLADGDREGQVSEIVALAKERGIILQFVERSKIEAVAGGLRHQGVLAYVAPVAYAELDDILAKAEAAGEPPFLLLLDELEENYEPADVSIPCPVIAKVDESNDDDIRVYGDFWIFNYTLDRDILQCESGGSYPGVIHLKKDDEAGYKVMEMEIVEDGRHFTGLFDRRSGRHFHVRAHLVRDDAGKRAFQIIHLKPLSCQYLKYPKDCDKSLLPKYEHIPELQVF